MKAAIITIGDEILIGQITDTNSAWLGDQLTLQGVEVTNMLTIPDKKAAIQNSLELMMDKVDLIFMTGGLGPTKDDITKISLAEYFGSELKMDEGLKTRIKTYFDTRNIPFLEAHEQQCLMPVKAKTLRNDMGTAPGMLFEKNGVKVLSMPGVPYEMKWIFTNSFLPILHEARDKSTFIYHKTIKTVGKGESNIAAQIQDLVDEFPPYISMSYLPSLGEVKLRLTARASEDKTDEVNNHVGLITERISDLVYGYDKTSLADSFRDLMIEKGLTLATAESCTAGYLAHKLTEVPGSSKYYMGSVVAYDYAPKMEVLKVRPDTLATHGAVSEETVKEMLSGLLDLFKTDMGIAISGIAGPGGGLPDKPVGTIWLAYGTKDAIKTKKLQLAKDRLKNIQYTAVAGINLLRRLVLS